MLLICSFIVGSDSGISLRHLLLRERERQRDRGGRGKRDVEGLIGKVGVDRRAITVAGAGESVGG